MKIIFLLDDNTAIVSSPEELQLRQIDGSNSAIVIPAGKNENGDDLFRPLISYPVVLVAPPKVEPPSIN